MTAAVFGLSYILKIRGLAVHSLSRIIAAAFWLRLLAQPAPMYVIISRCPSCFWTILYIGWKIRMMCQALHRSMPVGVPEQINALAMSSCSSSMKFTLQSHSLYTQSQRRVLAHRCPAYPTGVLFGGQVNFTISTPVSAMKSSVGYISGT